MQPELREAVRDWLANAQEDVETAALVEQAAPPKRRAAVYHAQQAAEKALKAYLTLREEPFDWTHSLSVLLDLCVRFDTSFESWRDVAEVLTPYATRFRYPPPPGGPQVPSERDVREAVRESRALFDFVLDRIPPEARPGGPSR